MNAEDPARGFATAPETLSEFTVPGGPFTRIETPGGPGLRITPYYGSLPAKAVVWAPDRDQAMTRMQRVLGEFGIGGPGIAATTGFLREVLAHPLFPAARHTTGFADELLVRQS